MRLANRSFLGIVYSSLLFGSLSVPYYYLALDVPFVGFTAILIVLAWLAPCTGLLLLIFVSKLNLEEKLANKLGLYFRPFVITLVVVALSISFLIELFLMPQFFDPSVVNWFHLIQNSGIATAVAFVIVIAARPSRLEKIIAAKVSRRNKSSLVYRAAGYMGLAIGLIFVSSKLYQYHLYNELCTPVMEPECQTLFGKQH